MAALLHCIVVEVENSRWKDHIRDWNTNMKVDMYDKMKEKLEKQKEHIINLNQSVFIALDTNLEGQFYDVCAECELFFCTETQGGKFNYDGFHCEFCIEKNPDLVFSDEEDDED